MGRCASWKPRALSSSTCHNCFAGHSLGGALAQLAAHDIQTEFKQQYPRLWVSCYALGGPRVGNRAFADTFHKSGGERCTANHRLHCSDIWCFLAKETGPCHGSQRSRWRASILLALLSLLSLRALSHGGLPSALIDAFPSAHESLHIVSGALISSTACNISAGLCAFVC